MNILIPDSWLREFLDTKASPKKIKEYLSLCGPSIERVNEVDGETVYDVEITTNRPDSMSVFGVAREASAILPRFGLKATLTHDPYLTDMKTKMKPFLREGSKKLHIETDPTLNPRWVSIVLDNVQVKSSPVWLQKKLELSGIRPINTVVDITNYVMRAYGQPAHAFDYDQIGQKNGISTMILRASKKREKLTTLDGKTHVLPGRDIVIEDGTGRIIDLAGIMGGENSSIKQTTKTIVLFLQTYDPVTIRRSSMALSHRTEAATLFEKGLDEELVMPTMLNAIDMVRDLCGGTPASKLYDIYPHPYESRTASVSRVKLDAYIGTHLSDKELSDMLSPLGFSSTITAKEVRVQVPSFRRDVQIDVDIIEEVARMYGYHNILPTLPKSAPPVVMPETTLRWEEEIKIRLRDWGYTETYTYSMISEGLMDLYSLNKEKAYKISNSLSQEWVYMRPTLWPSMFEAVKQNANTKQNLKLFELSMVYDYNENELPHEIPVLIVAWTGRKFLEAKGIAEAIFELFGLAIPEPPVESKQSSLHNWDDRLRLLLGDYGSVSEVNTELLTSIGIDQPVTIFWVHVDELIKHAKSKKSYTPIPRYPPSYEDIALVVPDSIFIGPLITTLKKVHPIIADIRLLDSYEDTRTIHVTYLSLKKNLTAEEVRPIREKLIKTAEKQFGAKLKT